MTPAPLTPEAVADLEAKARAAEADAPGPYHAADRGIGWEVHHGPALVSGDPKACWYQSESQAWCRPLNDEFRECFSRPVAQHIAAASPDRVLALCAAWRAQQAVVEAAREMEAAWDAVSEGALKPLNRVAAVYRYDYPETLRFIAARDRLCDALRALDGAAGAGEAG